MEFIFGNNKNIIKFYFYFSVIASREAQAHVDESDPVAWEEWEANG